MKYDFTTTLNRSDTGSLKWDKYRNRDILPLWVADMDFQSPPEVISALRERVEHGVFGYTIPYAEPVDAVLDYLRESHQIEAKAEWLVWLPGLVPALNTAARAFAGNGGSVYSCTPVYPPFLSAPANASVGLKKIPLLRQNDRWCIDFPQLEEQADDRGGVFFFCNPHNPVGQCFSETEIQTLLQFCRDKNLVLCSDEIHCDLLLNEDAQHLPTLRFSDSEKDRILALYAPSKTFNLPGLACAFAVIPHAPTRATFKRTCQGIITEINALGYVGCAAAYRKGEPWRQALIEALRNNRDKLYSYFAEELPELTLYPMEATYLAWVDCRCLGVENPSLFFEKAGVGLSDGAQFGNPGWVRINFGCPESVLLEGLDRIKRAVRTL